MTPALSLKDIRKAYRVGDRELEVVRGISMDINPGEMTAIMGASGSGKSTLLHIMGALDRPTGGTLHVEGVDVASLDDRTLAGLRNEKLGFVFQSFFLLNYYTALDNVCLPLVYASRPCGGRDEARSLLEKLGLGERIHHRPNELSGGERQRVAIARALINRPHIIFADEPTGSLDTKTGAFIMDLLESIHKSGTTVVLITHDPAVAKRAQRVYHIADGILI